MNESFIMDTIEDNDVWKVIESFFSEYGLVYHQIESYNHMLEVGIPSVIEDKRILSVEVNNKKYVIEFKPETLIYERPKHKETSEELREVYPFECINRNLTYESAVYIDIEVTNPYGDCKLYEKIFLGKIPVMTKSNLCRLTQLTDGLTTENMKYITEIEQKLADKKEDIYQHGGIFIINGAQKVIACQERTAFNKTYVFTNRKNIPRYEYYSEIRSCSITGSHSTQVRVGLLKDLISVLVPYIEGTTIPLGIVFRALGVVDEKDIISYITPDIYNEQLIELLLPSLEKSYECTSEEDALYYIGKRGKKFSGDKKITEAKTNREKKEERDNAISYARHLLSNEFLPHLGTDQDSILLKRYYLGYMTMRMLNVKLGKANVDDRDHFLNKRIATAGMLLTQQFHNAFRKLTSEIENSIERSIRNDNVTNITSLIYPKTITNMLRSALSNNTWSTKGKDTGISQQFEDQNYIAAIANSRKCMTPIEEGGKVDLPRKLHGGHWCMACPAETPEGKKCGLIKALAASALITMGSSTHILLEFLKSMKITPFKDITSANRNEFLKQVKVFANGVMFGVTKYRAQIIARIKKLRRTGNINPEVSVYYDQNNGEIHVSSEAGRMIRPLFIVENGKLIFTKKHLQKIESGEWDEPSIFVNLLSNGIVEFIDSCETENILLVNYPSEINSTDITHCELHPSMMYGLSASLIPYAHCNQSPRVTYQASMCKQAIGVPGTNHFFKSKGKHHSMIYPQMPITTTKIAKIIGYDQMPTGQNVIVFICPWQGFSQEDSIIINQDFIDRGGMNIVSYLSYETTIKIDKNEKLGIPIKGQCANFRGNTSKLDPLTYIVPKGTKVQKNDVLIGLLADINEKATFHRNNKINKSVIYDHAFPGIVHDVYMDTDGKGYPFVRVVVAQKRDPIHGDKFSAMHGQKGTVGMKYRSIDLPVTEDGVTPDIMINPLALPSRMTIGMLIEIITGKKICSTLAINRMSVKKAFNYDKPDGDPSFGKMDKLKFKTPKGGYSIHKNDGNSTAFEKDFSVNKICEELKKLGLNEFGDDLVINGQTGEYMECMVFNGICYYQRLKHMVIDKVHARSRGGRAALTRQPLEGKFIDVVKYKIYHMVSYSYRVKKNELKSTYPIHNKQNVRQH